MKPEAVKHFVTAGPMQPQSQRLQQQLKQSLWQSLRQSLRQSLQQAMTRSLFCMSLTTMLLSVLVFGCAANDAQISNELSANGVPRWVAIGSKTLKSKSGRVFHGVGSAVEAGDFARQTTIADQRAKSELENILNSYIEIVSRDYTASVKLMNESFIHQKSAEDINTITEINMPAVRVVGHWRDSKTGIVYSIAELSMTHVQTSLEKMKGLDDAFLSFLQSEGLNIFDRIARRDSD